MIKFIKLSRQKPYSRFKTEYLKALQKNQNLIEAISISSYESNDKFVDSRFVNLKFVHGNKFIFFSNYNSPKAQQFESFNQIAAAFFWDKTNVQIRMRAKIKKTSKKYNNEYFKKRSPEKNTLAISSNQSKKIDSYNTVIKNYNQTKNNHDLKQCPEYWGGYSFIPYYFEFWEGDESRINKREVFDKTDGTWKHSFLQP
jgi:pyridoxamine 5'-phosphate oxidase